MRFATVFAVALSAVAVSAHYNETVTPPHANGTETVHEDFTTTEVVTQYTTYCPYPTTIVENNHTYVVTEATTLTVTDCPCTRTLTYTYVTETICPGGCEHPTSVPDAGTNTNGTTVENPGPGTPGPNYTVPELPPPSNGAASNKATIFGGAVVAAISFAALLL